MADAMSVKEGALKDSLKRHGYPATIEMAKRLTVVYGGCFVNSGTLDSYAVRTEHIYLDFDTINRREICVIKSRFVRMGMLEISVEFTDYKFSQLN